MKKKLNFSISAILCFLLLSACSGNGSNGHIEAGDTLTLRYARNLTIVDFPDHTEVTLRNPWDTTSVLGSYCITTPLKNIGVFSSVHLALFHELQADDAVGGICDLEFCNLPYYRKAVAEGRIANLVNCVQPSLEQIINLNPDALLPSPFENS